LFCVLADAHEIEAQVCLVALLQKIELDELTADEMGDQRAEARIKEARPDEIAGDVGPEKVHRCRGGPEDAHIGDDEDNIGDKADGKRQVVCDEIV
jgi:hypothetical protein